MQCNVMHDDVMTPAYVCVILRMSAATCQACNAMLLPTAAALKATAEGMKKKRGGKNMRHVRSRCGHWLHYHCLDSMLTTPPFLHHCVTCERRIGHPDWNDDVPQLERAWQMEQAKKRELVRKRERGGILVYLLACSLLMHPFICLCLFLSI